MILIHMQVAIACLVSLRPHEVQAFDQPMHRLEPFQAVDVFSAYLAARCGPKPNKMESFCHS